MKQAIAGVTATDVEEVTVMIVWPSIARYPSGRFLGRLYTNKIGFGVLTLGNLLALASIPHALALYFYRLSPSILGLSVHGSFYRLTNRRVIELRNELNLKQGPRWMRFVGIAMLLLVIPPIFYLLGTVFWGEAVGGLEIHSLLKLAIWFVGLSCWGVCLLSILAAIIGIVAEVISCPVPLAHFTYGAEVKSIELDRFDSINIDRQSGQEWFDAGDLVFKQGAVERFRLEGVSRPESFLRTCQKSHASYVGVKQALAAELAPA